MSEGWLFRLRSGLGASQVAPAWPTQRGANRAAVTPMPKERDAQVVADARDDAEALTRDDTNHDDAR